MKNHILLLLALPTLLLCACKEDKPVVVIPSDKGTLSLSYVVTDDEGNTVKYTDIMRLVLTGAEDKIIDFPADGVVAELTPGQYTVLIETKPVGTSTVGFDKPLYAGSTETTVTAGEITNLDITCTPANAGIAFRLGQGLDTAGYGGFFMLVRQEGGELRFDASTEDKYGYFNAGEVSISVGTATKVVKIDDKDALPFALAAGDKYVMTISLQGSNPVLTIAEESNPAVSNEYYLTMLDYNYEMTKLLSEAFIYWNPDSDAPVEFNLRMRSDDKADEIWIRGFTLSPADSEFVLAEGVYRIGALPDRVGFGEAMTLVPGHIDSQPAYSPTMGFGRVDYSQGYAFPWEKYYAQSGEMNVTRKGANSYVITLDFTGDVEKWVPVGGDDSPFGNNVMFPPERKIYYLETPELLWQNKYITTGNTAYGDVPVGQYYSYGSPIALANAMIPGPESWTGNIARSLNPDSGQPDNWGWSLSAWGDAQGKLFLRHYRNRIFASNERGSIIENDSFFMSMMGAYINEYGELVFVANPEGRFDAATNTIDFTQKHPLGADLGICAAKEFIQLMGFYYLASDLYIGAKIEIGAGGGAPQAVFSADKVVKISDEMRRKPIRFESGTGCYPYRNNYK